MPIDDTTPRGFTRRHALLGAGSAAFTATLIGGTATRAVSLFTPLADAAGTEGSPVKQLLRPASSLDTGLAAKTQYPNQAYIETFIQSSTGNPDVAQTSSYTGKLLAYVKAGSVYNADLDPQQQGDLGDELAGTDPLVLRDTRFNKPIIGPEGGEYMPDLTNPTFRAKVVAICQRAIQKGHAGIWLDNVLNPIYSYQAQDGNAGGTMLGKVPSYGGAAPMPKRADGTLITTQAWDAGSASLLTELRTALPSALILSNVLWFAPYDEGQGATSSNPSFRTVAQKSTWINREGFVFWGSDFMDAGNMAATFNTVDGARAAVPTAAFCFDTFPGHSQFTDPDVEREYGLAAYLMVANGSDVFGDATQGSADWLGYHLDLGAASGARTAVGSSAWKRAFTQGYAVFNAGTGAASVALPSGNTYRKIDGTTVSGTVSVPAHTGLVLTLTPGPTQVMSIAAAVATSSTQLLSNDATYGAPRDWAQWYGTSANNRRRRNVQPSTLGTWRRVGTTTAPTTFTSQHTTFAWSDASSVPIGGTGAIAPASSGSGNGFSFSLPAWSSQTRTLKVYVGVRGLQTSGVLTGAFSTGQGTSALVTGTSDTDMIDRVFTIQLRPSAPSDVFTVQWLQIGSNANGLIALYAAQVF